MSLPHAEALQSRDTPGSSLSGAPGAAHTQLRTTPPSPWHQGAAGHCREEQSGPLELPWACTVLLFSCPSTSSFCTGPWHLPRPDVSVIAAWDCTPHLQGSPRPGCQSTVSTPDCRTHPPPLFSDYVSKFVLLILFTSPAI